MTEKKGLLLSEFKPRSELVVDRVEITEPKFPVIDIHGHFGPLVLGEGYASRYDTLEEVEKLKKLGVTHITNLETLWGEELDRLLDKVAPAGDFIITFGAVDILKLDDPDFPEYVEATLTESKAKGVKGIKLWKNISLGMKDKNGRYIPIDDPRLKPIFTTAAKLELPILIHIADPVAFFRTIDGYNERWEELQRNPDWAFNAPDLYTFDELMRQQENLIAQNPETTFIVAHVGSYGENLGWVGQCLDKYPNMHIDIAARIAELGRQPYTAREFFIKYQDRILFGTDGAPSWYGNLIYYEFLETWNEYIPYTRSAIPTQGRWRIYGIGLGDEVLEKVYNLNARKILNLK